MTRYHSTVVDRAVSTVACIAVLGEALVLNHHEADDDIDSWPNFWLQKCVNHENVKACEKGIYFAALMMVGLWFHLDG